MSTEAVPSTAESGFDRDSVPCTTYQKEDDSDADSPLRMSSRVKRDIMPNGESTCHVTAVEDVVLVVVSSKEQHNQQNLNRNVCHHQVSAMGTVCVQRIRITVQSAYSLSL